MSKPDKNRMSKATYSAADLRLFGLHSLSPARTFTYVRLNVNTHISQYSLLLNINHKDSGYPELLKHSFISPILNANLSWLLIILRSLSICESIAKPTVATEKCFH